MNVSRLSLDLQKILEGKRTLRGNLAARPVAEKLRMLDAMREREFAIRGRVKQRKEEVRMQKEDTEDSRK